MNDGKEFEQRVIEIARVRFSEAGGGRISIDGQERDGLFETRDVVHYIECTISRSKDKAKQDIGKLNSLKTKLERKFRKPVVLWFITKDEPTADQKAIAVSSINTIHAMSLNSFISTIFDANKYLILRGDYAFGSVRDPETNDYKLKVDYVPIELADQKNASEIWNAKKISKRLIDGERFLVTGQYGVGKSMTLREIYKLVSSRYRSNNINYFPVFINLRDHDGQQDPVEVIERHARKIGYPNPHELVQAWRGGFALLILDGFDELATIGWASKVQKLERIRYRSMEIVRRFVSETPSERGIIISGRTNYFDSVKEMTTSLSTSRGFRMLSIDDFKKEQIEKYLEVYKISIKLPEWIPSRPLLLGYLIAKKVLTNLPDTNISPAIGWNLLIDEISKREAAIDAGVSPENVRHILEKLACKSRNFTSNLGPITDNDLAKAFEDVVGYEPDDRGINIIQRLPGLGFSNEDGARYFIDENFAAAAKAGELARYVVDPFNHDFGFSTENWGQCLEPLGLEVLQHILIDRYQVSKGKWATAVESSYGNSHNVLSLDVYLSCRDVFSGWDRDNLLFENLQVPYLELSDVILESKITYRSVYFHRFDFSANTSDIPFFEECLFEHVTGISKEGQIPPDFFIDCIYGEFEHEIYTTSTILDLDLPTPVKVAYTILKKLYIQKGIGRKESALLRGLDHQEKRFVSEVLKCLSKNGYVVLSNASSNRVWLPIREKKKEVPKLIGSKNTEHELIKDLMKL